MTSVAGQGIYAGAFSPNGKKIALVAGSTATADFNLYIVPVMPRGNYQPTQTLAVYPGACQVSWSPDGQELAVMTPSTGCEPKAVGTIVAINPDEPGQADDPCEPGRASGLAAGPDRWLIVASPVFPAGAEPLVLVLPDGGRFPLQDPMTIGRGDDVTLKIDDRTVSRVAARIAGGPEGPMIEDAGSRFGITVSGQPLSEPRRLLAGQEIRLGNVVLRVDSAMPPAGASIAGQPGFPDPSAIANPNATLVVPVGATEMGLRPAAVASRDGSLRPRLRSGWALKRLDDEADHERYVLRDLREGTFMRMSEQDAQLVELLDGKRSVAELLVEASDRLGPSGAGRLARLVADFGERGMLDGVAPTPVPQEEPGFFARAFKTREKTFGWIPEYFQTAYRHWGRLFFSPLMVTLSGPAFAGGAGRVLLPGRGALRHAVRRREEAGAGRPGVPRWAGSRS